jgi:hypothetical protein
MNRIGILLIVAMCPLVALAQTGSPGTPAPSEPAYQPVAPAASTVSAYSGWPGYSSGGGTVAGNAMNGMASVISAQGDYNLSTSAAAVNMTQAQKNNIQNRQQWTNTYFDMRETNRRARAAERGPRPTMEQLARMARQGVPKPLGPGQMDPVTGRLNWPSALQEDAFAAERGKIDQLFAARARYGGLNYANQIKVREVIDTMSDALKQQIQEIPPTDYVVCRNFLQSVRYAATKTEIE